MSWGFKKVKIIPRRTGVIAEYYEDNLPVILKFINEMPKESIIEKYPVLMILSWKYDGSENNGMPQRQENEQMIILEESIEKGMIDKGGCVHAYSRTGNNLKELIYYCNNATVYIENLNFVLKGHVKYPIDITYYNDSCWLEFRELLDDINNKG